MRNFKVISLATIFSLMISINAIAEDQEQEPGVARISLMNGEVTTQRGDSGDWVAATVNAPVVNGDRVATGARSRAEVQLDFANVLRLNENSQVQVQELAKNRIQVQVVAGLANYVVFQGAQADAEITTPIVSVRPKSEGVYRISVDNQGQTVVTVRRGEAQISTAQGSATVRQGQKITARGSASELEYRIDAAAGKDEWDTFNEERNNSIQNAQSYRYTNQYYTGVSDLDNHGRWAYVPGYDWCWTPYVSSGWTPYSDGRWTWEPYYGWTWVGYEPWGWAPYHYGRWFCHNSVWSWWPGPVWGFGMGYRPIWSPAYVSFFGFGYGHHNFGFGIGFGFGSIGWLPTGPCDPFVPWYGHGGWGRGGYYGHYNTVNVTNITNINNINNVTNIRNVTGIHNAMAPLSSRANGFSNLQALQRGDTRVAGAFNMVSSDRFGQGSLKGAIQRPGPSALSEGRLVAGGLPVVPTKASLSPSSREVNTATIPRNSIQQQSFTRQQPSIRTQSFSQSAAQVQQMVQRQNSQTTLNENRSIVGTGSGVGAPGASRSVNSPRQGSGSRTVGGSPSPAGNNGASRAFETVPGANGRNAITEQRQAGQPQQSWRRFGAQTGSTVETQGDRSAYDRSGASQPGPFRSNPGAAVQNGSQNGSWHRFSDSGTDAQRQMAPSNRSTFSSSRSIPDGNSQTPSRSPSTWRQFSSQPSSQPWAGSSSSRPGNSGGGRYSGRSSDRPPLDMNRFIVTQRNPGNSGYNAPRGSYGGSVYSAPRSAPSGGYSAPRSYPSSPQGGGGSGSWGGSHGSGGSGSSGGRAGGSSGHSGGGSRR